MPGSTIGWIDGTGGASGDMLLGALVDVGVPVDVVRGALDRLGLGIDVRVDGVVRGGLEVTKVHVDAPDSNVERGLTAVLEVLDALDGPIHLRAASTFQRLAVAEAEVHGCSVDDVHFHEVGALDSIADVVGVCAGFAHLDLDELHCSTLSLGSGMTRSAHGPIPVPAPAVLAVLRNIGAVAAGPASFEATTPTGAALLAEWTDHWGELPPMTIDAVGSGAGSRDSDAVVNAVRLVVGARSDQPGRGEAPLVQIDANVDDLDPRMWPEAIVAAMEAGAVDAWVTPIVMKKGRPAHTFSALCSATAAESVTTAIFRDTSTIGVRSHRVDREVLERVEDHVEVADQTIRVKTALRNGVVVNRSTEWDDVLAAARRTGWSPKRIAADAIARFNDLDEQESPPPAH